MTTHPDTPEPRAGAPTPEPMSEARIAELRAIATGPSQYLPDLNPLKGYAFVVLECLSEITRLRAVIAERDATVERLEIDNNRLCEELNTIEIEVPDER